MWQTWCETLDQSPPHKSGNISRAKKPMPKIAFAMVGSFADPKLRYGISSQVQIRHCTIDAEQN
jgi:hypothetical protein